MAILDQYGSPIDKTVLDKEIARPSMTGVRSIWNNGYVTGGLTPQRLAALLRDATEGNADAQLTLAEEMEEKDLHYASVLGTRKRAVARLPIVVEAASDDPKDVKLADEIRELFKTRRLGTKGMIEESLDALGKGYSAVEIMWDKSRQPWKPGRFEWRDPRFFQFDRETMRELRLKDEADLTNGIPLPPYKFIIHKPRLKCGIPIRGGLARLAAWTYIFKNYTIKDMAAFCEVFGMPLRLGKYRPGETEDNISILRAAVANLGSDAAAVIPEGMMIEFIETAQARGGEVLFISVADWFDKQMSKAILGQTMTADDGSSNSQAKVHNEVREDIRDADSEQLAETLERDLVIPYIDLNHGPQERYPSIYLREPDQTDIPVMSEALAKLVPLGLRVEASEVRDKLGFSDPAKDAECLGQSAPVPPTPPKVPAKNHAQALNSEQVAPESDAADLLEGRLQDKAMAETDKWLEQLRQLVMSATDMEDLRDRIIELYGQMDPSELGGIIAQATTLADCAGQADIQDGM